MALALICEALALICEGRRVFEGGVPLFESSSFIKVCRRTDDYKRFWLLQIPCMYMYLDQQPGRRTCGFWIPAGQPYDTFALEEQTHFPTQVSSHIWEFSSHL